MKEKEEDEENKCNNSGTERRNVTKRSTVDTMSVLMYNIIDISITYFGSI